jgi:hypothetical protein
MCETRRVAVTHRELSMLIKALEAHAAQAAEEPGLSDLADRLRRRIAELRKALADGGMP